jgi:elongation factor P
MVQATQLRPGMVIKHEGELYSVFSLYHRTPGNKRGFVQTRLRSLRSGSIIDYRFRSEDMVERAILDEIEFEYLYSDADTYYFMNTETFEQIGLPTDVVGETRQYIVPNVRLKIEFYEGKPIGIDLPQLVELTVTETAPGLRAATASAVMKPAKTETGLVVQVPAFINSGDRIRVDTSDGHYVQRAE